MSKPKRRMALTAWIALVSSVVAILVGGFQLRDYVFGGERNTPAPPSATQLQSAPPTLSIMELRVAPDSPFAGTPTAFDANFRSLSRDASRTLLLTSPTCLTATAESSTYSASLSEFVSLDRQLAPRGPIPQQRFSQLLELVGNAPTMQNPDDSGPLFSWLDTQIADTAANDAEGTALRTFYGAVHVMHFAGRDFSTPQTLAEFNRFREDMAAGRIYSHPELRLVVRNDGDGDILISGIRAETLASVVDSNVGGGSAPFAFALPELTRVELQVAAAGETQSALPSPVVVPGATLANFRVAIVPSDEPPPGSEEWGDTFFRAWYGRLSLQTSIGLVELAPFCTRFLLAEDQGT
jgi:hypothetical protein